MLEAMVAAAPIQCKTSARYTGDCEILMVYGTGHPVRRPWQREHVAKGGRLIGWDLGYWRRVEGGMRVTLDSDHPQAFIRPEPAQRWADQGIEVKSLYKPDGHVLIIGMGLKANRAHNLQPLSWETRAAKMARAAYPNRRIVFKPKKDRDPVLAGFVVERKPIAEALHGASLVVCRHSNVAVDACIAGVPVFCEDGAASALYGPGSLAAPIMPTLAERLAFLRSLAWWNWRRDEAKQAWAYLLDRITNG